MITAQTLREHLQRLVQATPGAFRSDPVFRYAALGAAVTLLASFANMPSPQRDTTSAPPRATPSQVLGTSYNDRRGLTPSAQGLTPSTLTSIAPSRTLDGVRIIQDPKAPLDHFGVVSAALPHRSKPDVRP